MEHFEDGTIPYGSMVPYHTIMTRYGSMVSRTGDGNGRVPRVAKERQGYGEEKTQHSSGPIEERWSLEHFEDDAISYHTTTMITKDSIMVPVKHITTYVNGTPNRPIKPTDLFWIDHRGFPIF